MVGYEYDTDIFCFAIPGIFGNIFGKALQPYESWKALFFASCFHASYYSYVLFYYRNARILERLSDNAFLTTLNLAIMAILFYLDILPMRDIFSIRTAIFFRFKTIQEHREKK